MTNKIITIATRNSPLALWQAKYAAGLIESHFPHISTQLLPMTTKGDEILDQSLNKIGGKGLFLKELEQAMLAGKADIAVHSMKDVPAAMPKEFTICSIFQRHDVSDAFVSNSYNTLEDLPAGAIVGTSSLRRQAQLLALRSDLTVKPLRGNVQTRLQKLDSQQFDAIILASAGLERLKMDTRIKQKLTPKAWLPAVGQGAIGVECLSSRIDLVDLLAELNHEETAQCVHAERAMNKLLNGSCASAIGAYAELKKGNYEIHAVVGTADGKVIIRQQAIDHDAIEAGTQIAFALLAAGAMDILAMADA